MTTLYVESEALTIEVRDLLVRLSTADHALSRRLRKASEEVTEHVAEGMCHTGRARRQEYVAALDAARETLACLRAATGSGLVVSKDRALEARAELLVNRIVNALAA